MNEAMKKEEEPEGPCGFHEEVARYRAQKAAQADVEKAAEAAYNRYKDYDAAWETAPEIDKIAWREYVTAAAPFLQEREGVPMRKSAQPKGDSIAALEAARKAGTVMVQTLEIPHAEGYPPIKVVLHAAYAALAASHTRLLLALTNCRNGLELILQKHEPAHPDDPWDTINELRETVRKSNEVLREALRMARELEGA